MLKVTSGDVGDPRAATRANVFLTASLVADGSSRPVRVRNISARGALLDGPALPPEGSVVHLRRGRLSVDGEIAWQCNDQCGLRFETDVVVSDWVKRVEHRGQEKVDELVEFLRQHPSRADVEVDPAAQGRADECLKSIVAELESWGQRMSSSPRFVAEYADELLRLDSIIQRLSRFNDAAGT